MLQILDNVIRMTKGDSGVFNISVYTPDNKIYEIKENDKVYFYLSRGNKKILTKEFNDCNITINPSDTEFLRYGEYMWKCVLEKDNEGEPIRSTVSSGKFYLVNY